ncbi:hypothetical protein DFH29DRAFT_880074 [Suillus ampliporus]|nr:hypothetical protein DFH29DRAFT_880074 [Suillus ampliporus]
MCAELDKDDVGEEFVCDEEPRMLLPEQNFRYYPISLGQQLREGKLEIVRKQLGWASVWLARTLVNVYPANYVAVKVVAVNAIAGVFEWTANFSPPRLPTLRPSRSAKKATIILTFASSPAFWG